MSETDSSAVARGRLRFMFGGVAVLGVLLVAYIASDGLVRPIVGLLLIAALAVFNIQLWRPVRSRSKNRN